MGERQPAASGLGDDAVVVNTVSGTMYTRPNSTSDGRPSALFR